MVLKNIMNGIGLMMLQYNPVEIIQLMEIFIRPELITGDNIAPFKSHESGRIRFVQIMTTRLMHFDDIVVAVIADDLIGLIGRAAVGQYIIFLELRHTSYFGWPIGIINSAASETPSISSKALTASSLNAPTAVVPSPSEVAWR